MKNHFFLFSLISLLLTFNSCSKHEDIILLIDYAGYQYEQQELTFSSSTTDIYDLEWEFGDGTTAKGNEVTHKYLVSGTYEVKLKAMYNDCPVEAIRTIQIKALPYIKITRVQLLEIDPFLNWDPSDGPDVFFKLVDEFGQVLIDGTTVYNNVTANDAPLWNIDPNLPPQVTDLNKDYYFLIYDKDANEDQLMFTRFWWSLPQAPPFESLFVDLFSSSDNHVLRLYLDFVDVE